MGAVSFISGFLELTEGVYDQGAMVGELIGDPVQRTQRERAYHLRRGGKREVQGEMVVVGGRGLHQSGKLCGSRCLQL